MFNSISVLAILTFSQAQADIPRPGPVAQELVPDIDLSSEELKDVYSDGFCPCDEENLS